jgi:hypothetical protein
MEATRSSETSVYNKPTQCHFLEDGIMDMNSSSVISLNQKTCLWKNSFGISFQEISVQ